MTDEIATAAFGIKGMGVSPIDVGMLGGETPREEIRTRQGPGGRNLDYVDARYVMKVLDEKVGPEFWQCQYAMEGQKVACGIGVKIDGEWVWKWDGAGETDIEGEKGSFSDAFKRAGVKWGIARDLYPEPNQTAPRADAGRASPSARPAAAPMHEGMGDDDGLQTPPRCPRHGYPMKPSRSGPGWFCSSKAKEGEPNRNGWCVERVGQ